MQETTYSAVELDRTPSARLIQRGAQFVCDHALWIVIPIVLSLLFPSDWMGLGFAAAIGLFASRWMAAASPFPSTRLNFPILVLLTMTAAGFLYSSAPDLALLTAGQVVASVTLFTVVIDKIRTRADLWRLAAALVVLGVLMALAAPFTVAWTGDKLFALPAILNQAWPRLPKLTNANILAGALAPIVPIALALAMQSERRWRIVGAVALAPLALILVLLESRGAIFALGVGLAVWATLYRKWVLPLLPLALLAILAINQQMGGPPPAQFFYGKIGTETGGTLIERQDMWRQSLYLVSQAPLLGIGLGAYPRIAPYTWPYSPAHPSAVENHTHNLFLQVALDTGILGLVAFVALFAISLDRAWRAFRGKLDRHMAVAVLAALVVIIVHGFGDTAVWGSAKSSLVLWFVLALSMGLDKVREIG